MVITIDVILSREISWGTHSSDGNGLCLVSKHMTTILHPRSGIRNREATRTCEHALCVPAMCICYP